MYAMPSNLKLKLLEFDPTLTLPTILSFTQRLRAKRDLASKDNDVATCIATLNPSPLHATDDFSKVTTQQQQQEKCLSKLQATMDALVAMMSVLSPNTTISKSETCHKNRHNDRTYPLCPTNHDSLLITLQAMERWRDRTRYCKKSMQLQLHMGVCNNGYTGKGV